MGFCLIFHWIHVAPINQRRVTFRPFRRSPMKYTAKQRNKREKTRPMVHTGHQLDELLDAFYLVHKGVLDL